MGEVSDRLDDLSAAASAAAEDLKDAAEDAKRRGLQALVDLGLKAQEALDSMPAEDGDTADGEAPPEATTLPA